MTMPSCPELHALAYGILAWRVRVAALPMATVARYLLACALVLIHSPGNSIDASSSRFISEEWHAPRGETLEAGVGEEALAAVQELPRIGPFILSLGRPMPKQPFPGQRRPPCERGERAINGGCWVIVGAEEKPPCGEKMFDYEGRCYFASFDSQRQPTSGER